MVGQPRCVPFIINFLGEWAGDGQRKLYDATVGQAGGSSTGGDDCPHAQKVGRKHTIGNRSAAATQAETVNRSEKRIEDSQAKRSETRRTTADCSQLTTEIENSAEQSAKRRRRRRHCCCCCLPSQRRERGNRDRLQSACPSPSSKPAAQRAN